jgi:hypothetical protein
VCMCVCVCVCVCVPSERNSCGEQSCRDVAVLCVFFECIDKRSKASSERLLLSD